LWPLASSWRPQGSLAGRMLFATMAVSAGLVLWRALNLWFITTPVEDLNDPTWANTLYVVLSSTLPLFTSVGFLLLYNEIMQAELQCLARIDPLTGVNNRLALGEWAQRLFRRAQRTRSSFAALMLDADHFKSINDRFGHAGGDRVLLSLVASIHASIGAGDVIGRVGGEEFVLLAPDTDMAGAMALGERVRAAVEGSMLRLGHETLSLTVSIGVSVSQPDEDDVDALLARADAALYAAKRAGRNCVMGTDREEATALDLRQSVSVADTLRELRA
ncbi:MAG: GGDEF domain-containing protein, partial [Dyella sp.]